MDEERNYLSDEQKKEFEELSLKMIEFIRKNCNQHTTIIVGSCSAEMLEGEHYIVHPDQLD